MSIMSFSWLILGGLLRLFDFGRWTIPLAAWLAPVFLLHFSRSNDPFVAAGGIWIALFLAALFAYGGVIPVPGAAYPVTIAFFAILWTIPYSIDSLLAGRIAGFAYTLIFPLAWVVVEFMIARLSPFGTWGSIAYTQYGNYPLMQLASTTGLWGITFLIAWFASTVNWVWDNQFHWDTVQIKVVIYFGIWSLTMLGGGARWIFRRQGETTRIAAVGWPEGILDARDLMRVLLPNSLADREQQDYRKAFCEIQDYFLERSKQEAGAGAKMVVWPEISLMVFQEDEAAFLGRAKQLAFKEDLYLLMGIATIRPDAPRPVENKAVLVTPKGEIAYSYTKSHPVPGWEALASVRGDGIMHNHDSVFGRIASPICYEMDFPPLIRQVGRAGVDTMLVPASDQAPIKHLHHAMAVFRAVENGVSMVRTTRWGISTAVDHLGRTLAIMDDSTSKEKRMTAEVPVTGVRTIYSRMGDIFAWICVAALILSVASVVVRVR